LIVIAAQLAVDPERDDDFVAAIGPLVAASRAENGCAGYGSP
jgi:quinol monooxygenase YgiN